MAAMNTRAMRMTVAAGIGALALGTSGTASAASWTAVQDTFVYEFLGNQALPPDGDSGGILVWNHESVHGGKGLVQFDSGWITDPALAGNFTATLHLYQFCEISGFI